MVAEARYGFSETEEAAFVIRDAEGLISFVRWPPAGVKQQARWPGAFPAGTIAIVHTHPNRIPNPSALDERAARRKGIPIYVLTRTKITRTTGGGVEVVVDGDWSPRAALVSFRTAPTARNPLRAGH
jgi:hypothetical protein